MKRCAGEDVHLPAESPPRARDSSGPRGPWGSYRPANSTRISPSLSSFISPRTIDPKKAALNTLVSSQDGEDLSAALLSEMAPFRRRGHLRPAGEGCGRPGGAGRRWMGRRLLPEWGRLQMRGGSIRFSRDSTVLSGLLKNTRIEAQKPAQSHWCFSNSSKSIFASFNTLLRVPSFSS